MLCGLLLPTSGKGKVAGFDLMKEPEKIKQAIGYMSQKFSLYDDLTAIENLHFFGGIYGLSGSMQKVKEKEVLEMIGLQDLQDRITRTLDVGSKQRLALGCAILHEPSILFLDEPTSALDVSVQAQMLNFLESLQERMSLTYLFISHNLAVIRYTCDGVAVMYLGKIVELGDKTVIFTDPLHPYTQALLAALPIPVPHLGHSVFDLVLDILATFAHFLFFFGSPLLCIDKMSL